MQYILKSIYPKYCIKNNLDPGKRKSRKKFEKYLLNYDKGYSNG